MAAAATSATVSPNVIWDVVRKTSSFRKSSQGITLSADPLNIEGKHSFRASGFAKAAVIGIVPVAKTIKHSSGYAVAVTNPAAAHKPKSYLRKTELTNRLKAGAATVSAAAAIRRDLSLQALARFSRVRKAGHAAKPVSGPKTGGKRAKKSE